MKTVWRWGQKIALDRRIGFNVTGQTYLTFFFVLICSVVSWAQITMDLSFMAAQVRWIYTQRCRGAFDVVKDNFLNVYVSDLKEIAKYKDTFHSR